MSAVVVIGRMGMEKWFLQTPAENGRPVMQVLKIAVVSACFAALVSPVVAQGQKKGFGEETEVTLGNSGKPQKFEGQGGEGTTTTTTTGPKGQLKQDECQSPNCETEVTDRPGRSN